MIEEVDPMVLQQEENLLPVPASSANLLKTAIQQLSVFADTYRGKGDFEGLEVVNGTLVAREVDVESQGLTALTRCFLRANFSTNGRKQEEERQKKIQSEIVRALDVVKCHYRVIEKLSHGSDEEKNLAKLAIDVLGDCNRIIEEVDSLSDTWRSRFVPFLPQRKRLLVGQELKESTLPLPPFPSVEKVFSTQPIKTPDRSWRPLEVPILSPSFYLFQEELYNPFKKETPNQMVDAFRMKSISLIGQHAIPATTIKEAVQLVRGTPICVTRELENPNVVSMSQVVLPFPGEWIETKGSFQTDEQNRPIPESFQVSSKSTQSGYPHPRQYFWALGSPLLPDQPLRPHASPRFKEVLRKKNELAHALLPKGSLIHRAKVLLELKQQILREKRVEYLQQHRLITEGVIWSSGTSTLAEEQWQIVDRFYQVVEKLPEPFSFLAKVQDLMMESYLHEPYAKLNGEWLEFEIPSFISGSSEDKAAFASQLLTQERKRANESLSYAIQESKDPDKNAVFEFIRFLGEKISIAAHPIIMQEMSEKIGFLPPPLNDFSSKLLTAAIKQATMFREELEAEWTGDPQHDRILLEQLFRQQIQRDLAIFSVPTFRSVGDPLRVITSELERYYRARFLRTL